MPSSAATASRSAVAASSLSCPGATSHSASTATPRAASSRGLTARAEADGRLRIALAAATLADARAIMVEGESGLLAIAPEATRPTFEPSLQRLTWPNGAMAKLYSAAEPEGLRGPEHHIAWADECAKWDNGSAAWDNLAMSLRLGSRPQLVATTTPRPVPLIRRLMGEAGVTTTRGRMADNALNLAPPFVSAMRSVYAGTRLGRQELDGELIDDVEGALWTRSMIQAAFVDRTPDLVRVVVGVDPPGGEQGRRVRDRRCRSWCRRRGLYARGCERDRRLARTLGPESRGNRSKMGRRPRDRRSE